MDIIDSRIKKYITDNEISGGGLIVRKNGDVVYKKVWGYADKESCKPITFDSIYRMMSMTKCVTAVGILKLIEKNLIKLDDPISKYIPELKDMRVSTDKRYVYSPDMNKLSLLLKIPFFRMDKVKSKKAKREITIRDFLSHSSGLEQGIGGLIAMMKDKSTRESLQQQAKKYSRYVLDFEPGEGTGYSPIAGFDMLTLIIERVTGTEASQYFKKEIFEPLNMKDSTFWPDKKQTERLVRAYKKKKDKLIDVTGTNDDIDGMLHRGKNYIAGCGGLFSTLIDYENFAYMLCSNGYYDGKQFLSEESVKLLHTEAPKNHLEPEPGQVWGLGVKIRQDPKKANSSATKGTYGWSGAFGTHFFISPEDKLDCVWVTNRTDLGGSGSFISKEIEEMVFEGLI